MATRIQDRDPARRVSETVSSHGSDTDLPPVVKPAGLDENEHGLSDAGGSDTEVKEGTKAGIGED